MNLITTDAQETRELGEKVATEIADSPSAVLLLYGDLGSGKTTLIQGMAKGLGIQRRIISPTFIIVRSYELHEKRKAKNAKRFYHIDLYRTETEDDLKGLGLAEILSEENAIVAIEWPEKLGALLPKKRWEIHFKTLGENKREVSIEKI